MHQESHVTVVANPLITDRSAALFRLATKTLVSPIKLPWHADYSFSYRATNEDAVTTFKCIIIVTKFV